ncbi:MAG: FprA family A-type flavoprotein [Actinobacteria bacterium]|nr:FprA family A-type flavoprotein [Actinomycetota bacterium]
MQRVPLADGIYWVGAVDWGVREFHGYDTPHGSSYNSYLIVDEKVCVVDGVRAGLGPEMLRRVRGCCQEQTVDYLVVNHVEMDHSGCLPWLIEQLRPRKILTSKRGQEALALHFTREECEGWDVMAVGTGDEINLGSYTLSFIEAPMLHWPDSMFTYVKEPHILLPNDAFGQHLASSRRFADELDMNVVMEEAVTYFANILMPFAGQVTKTIEKLIEMGLEIDTIAPSHGAIWRLREHVDAIIEAYAAWARFEAKPRVCLVYDTMWHSTEKMAYAVADGVAQEDVEVTILPLSGTPLARVARYVQESRAFLVGSPVLNNGMLPNVGRFLTYIKGLRPKSRLTGAFGSFGWGGGAVKEIDATLRSMSLDVLEPLEVRYVPNEEELIACEEYGRQVARRVKEWVR